MAQFGEWIRRTREAKGFLANFCANRAGIHPSVWSNWEHGRSRRKNGEPTEPRPETVRAIAHGLGVPLTEALVAAYGEDNHRISNDDADASQLDGPKLFAALDADDQQEVLQIMHLKWKRRHPGQADILVDTRQAYNTKTEKSPVGDASEAAATYLVYETRTGKFGRAGHVSEWQNLDMTSEETRIMIRRLVLEQRLEEQTGKAQSEEVACSGTK